MLQNKLKYYQEITIIPSQEINLNFIMGKVFSSLHIIFVNNQIENIVRIGVSFPEYDSGNNTLGSKIRIFFEDKEFSEKVNIKKSLRFFDDYIHITNLKEVPENTKYAMFKRVQFKGNKFKLARRYAKRKNISYDQALDLYKDYEQEISKLPYIKMTSSSNGNKYNIFIEKIESENKGEGFNTYGLSVNSSVPIF